MLSRFQMNHDDLKLKHIAECLDNIDTVTKRLKRLNRVVLLELHEVSAYEFELRKTERVLTMLLVELDGYDQSLVEHAKYHTKKLK